MMDNGVEETRGNLPTRMRGWVLNSQHSVEILLARLRTNHHILCSDEMHRGETNLTVIKQLLEINFAMDQPLGQKCQRGRSRYN